MHRLLKRQINRVFGNGGDISNLPEKAKQLLQLVEETYIELTKRDNYSMTLLASIPKS